MQRYTKLAAFTCVVSALSLGNSPIHANEAMTPRVITQVHVSSVSNNVANENQLQPGRYGPFATLRRANEVAEHFRNLGYRTQIIYLGSLDYREYAVDVY